MFRLQFVLESRCMHRLRLKQTWSGNLTMLWYGVVIQSCVNISHANSTLPWPIFVAYYEIIRSDGRVYILFNDFHFCWFILYPMKNLVLNMSHTSLQFCLDLYCLFCCWNIVCHKHVACLLNLFLNSYVTLHGSIMHIYDRLLVA
jgi:hypothetical protein